MSATQGDSDSERSWHCGCPYDPYPDDPFQGHDPPEPDFEKEAEDKKVEGVKKHRCRRAKSSGKSKKKEKRKVNKQSIKITKEDLIIEE